MLYVISNERGSVPSANFTLSQYSNDIDMFVGIDDKLYFKTSYCRFQKELPVFRRNDVESYVVLGPLFWQFKTMQFSDLQTNRFLTAVVTRGSP